MRIIAEFDDAELLIRAAEKARESGFSGAVALTPFPIPELEAPLGIRRTRLPYAVLAMGLLGTLTAFLIIYWTNGIDYALDVGGRPLNSFVADIPIMFETTILFAGTTAFFLFFASSGMPRLWEPWADVPGIEGATIDRYWLTIEPEGEEPGARFEREMREIGAVNVFRSPEAP